MSNYEALVEDGKKLYSVSVNQVLSGFQLVEEQLKTYIECHFDSVRTILNGRLYFDFKRDDYQDAALGRLTQVFSKICANKQLVTDLRAMIKRRDHIAHRALLMLYGPDMSPAEYIMLGDELMSDMRRISDLLDRILGELQSLRTG